MDFNGGRHPYPDRGDFPVTVGADRLFEPAFDHVPFHNIQNTA